MKRLLRLFKKIRDKDAASSWKLTYTGFKPAEEGLREALCTLGNGYFATRAAACESAASRIRYPGTYIAGVYNKLPTRIAGRIIFNEDLVNCPNWLPLSFRIEKGKWMVPSPRRIIAYRQTLDLRKGVLNRKIRLRDRHNHRTTIETQRIVHMAEPHHAAIRYVIVPENYEGWITIRSGLDGGVQNSGVARYRQLNSKHLRAGSVGTFGKNGISLLVRTSQSDIKIAQAAKVHIFSAGREIRPGHRILVKENKAIYQEFRIFVRKKRRYEIEKIVAVYTSADSNIRDPLTAAVNSVKNAHRFQTLLKSHQHAWSVLWKKFDVQIAGDVFSQKVIRLHIFHLLQVASIHNAAIDAGLPARGLHGEAYRGHIFWDELFVLPFFNLHAPEISRALLLYRYRRLPQARKYAEQNWYRGAMFPWQSASTGEEETPLIHLNPLSRRWDPDFSHFQRHVSFAIAYNVWKYWKQTGDLDFFLRYGAEIFLSVAKFAASLTQYNFKDKRYHTEGVMGPDEFHEKLPGSAKPGVTDNAYTNLLIVWMLIKAREMLTALPSNAKMRILAKLGLDDKELLRWEYISRKMNFVVNDEGVVSQYDGYFRLKELDWEAYKKKYGNIHRMDRILRAEGKSPNEYKVAKQADFLMIFYFLSLAEVKDLFQNLGYTFDRSSLKKNYAYYVKRTSHGSTLSKVVHCYLALLLGKSKDAWRLFLDVLKSDIYDSQGGTTPEGIHTGVMAGSINIVTKMFAGINIFEDRIRISPNLPKNWRSVKLRLRYKGRWISLSVAKEHIEILIRGPQAKNFLVPVEIHGKLHYFRFGKIHRVSLKTRR